MKAIPQQFDTRDSKVNVDSHRSLWEMESPLDFPTGVYNRPKLPPAALAWSYCHQPSDQAPADQVTLGFPRPGSQGSCVGIAEVLS